MNGPAEDFPLFHHGHEESGDFVGMAGILAGGVLLHHHVLGVAHHLAAQMGRLDLENVPVILQNVYGLVHHKLELILGAKRIFQVHSACLLFAFIGFIIAPLRPFVIELLVESAVCQ